MKTLVSSRTYGLISNMCGFWCLALGFLVLPSPSCSNSDNLALLLDTLKVVQRAVCNDDIVSLACPRGTTISIQVAQYSRVALEKGCAIEGARPETEAERNCKRPNSLQYSLLQTVVEACQKKPQCKFSTVPSGGQVDPCPTQSKYVEVAYKCRPYEFRSRTGCEGEVIKLSCNPRSRIAIFDAQYGRTAYESVTCFQTQGELDETCTAQHAVKTVISLCLGRRRCQIPANNKTFESTCRPQSSPYLKVIYACVPLGILSEKYESAAERDEISGGFHQEEDLFDESDSGERWGEPNMDHALLPPSTYDTSSTTAKYEEATLQHNVRKNPDQGEETVYNNSKLLIYISVGILAFFVLIGVLIGVRCYISRKTVESKNGDMYTTEAPNVFNDAFSDIDDPEISHISGTFHDPIHPDMILYKNVPGNRGTIRAMKPLSTIYSTIYPTAETNMYGVDYVPSQTRDVPTRFTRSRSNEEEMNPNVMTSPRSLGAHSSSHYYYG